MSKYVADGPPVTIGTREIDGVAYEIQVTPAGRFTARFDDTMVESDTLDKVLDNLRTKLRKRKVAEKAALPVTVTGSGSYFSSAGAGKGGGTVFRHGIVTGIHASNQSILFREDPAPGRVTPKTEQISTYGGRNVYRRLTKEEMAEHDRLRLVVVAAREAAEKWDAEHALDVRKELALLEEKAGVGSEVPRSLAK